MVFSLAEVVPAEELLQADYVGTLGRCFSDPLDRPVEVQGAVSGDLLLHQSDFDNARSSHDSTKIVVVRRLCLLFATTVLSVPLAAQRVEWRTRAVLYADNTEFFTPYRVGETILGGNITSWLEAATGRRTSLRVGLFADRRWGSEQFTDSLKPVLQVAYRGRNSTAILGTLDATRRHGLIDPLMVSTRELTTPIEYGLQWRERRAGFRGELWVNWQKLNTQKQREAFELGAVLSVEPTDFLRLTGQHLWSHHGGQWFDAGVPVTNNRVTALGVSLQGDVPLVRRGSLSVSKLWSNGYLDPDTPVDRPDEGSGWLTKLLIEPSRGWSLFVSHWRGTDFHAAAGDPNYGSAGLETDFYRAERKYTEIGAIARITPRRERITLDAEVRWHRIDDEKSEAFFNTSWELSYRLVVRAPLDVRLRR